MASFSLCMVPRVNFHTHTSCLLARERSIKLSDWVLPGHDNPRVFIRERVKELALRQKTLELDRLSNVRPELDLTNTKLEKALGSNLVDVAYDRCRELFLFKNDPFTFGSLFLNQQKQKACWAIWAWLRRLDEMVDGLNGSFATHETLDLMEERLVEIYQGRPRDIYDVALADTVSRYPVDFQLFKDVLDGTRVDLVNKGFKNFEEHYLYRYYVGSASLLPLVQVMGLAPESTESKERIYGWMATLGIALAIVDMLRDIGEDAKEGKIYFSHEELKLAGVSEDDIFKGRVTDNWRKLMREQIKQARVLLDEGAKGINELNIAGRLALWTDVLIYKQDLKVVEARNYDCFTNKSEAGKARRIAILPLAFAKSLGFF